MWEVLLPLPLGAADRAGGPRAVSPASQGSAHVQEGSRSPSSELDGKASCLLRGHKSYFKFLGES